MTRWKEQQVELKKLIAEHNDIVKIIHNDRKPLNAKEVAGYSMKEIKTMKYLMKMKKKKERRK